MSNCVPLSPDSGLKPSDYIAILAIIVSLSSLFFSIYFIRVAKKFEILYQEFEKLCIKNVENILSGLDKIFDENETSEVNDFRNQITETLLELQVFLLSLRDNVYKKINLGVFIKIIESFTEKIYNDKNSTLLEQKGSYYSTKLKIYHYLYIYAIKKELSLRHIFSNKK